MMLFAQTLSDAPMPSPGDYGTAFMQMFFTLIAVVLLLWVTVWFLRNLIQKRLQRGSNAPSIQILEKRMLSTKSVLYLVEVEGKKILIAESHLEVRPISEIQEQSAVSAEHT
jgi:flagellar protein FliO/FliZ